MLCQSKCVHEMLYVFMLCTSCQSKCVQGMLQVCMLYTKNPSIKWCIWNIMYSCCVQAFNRSLYMEYHRYQCCVQAVNQMCVTEQAES